MPLAQLLQPPFTSKDNFDAWAFYQNDAHKNIIQAFQLKGVNLTYYPLWPVIDDLGQWQLWHQQMHFDMTRAAHTQVGAMGDIEFTAGHKRSEEYAIWNDYMEHLWVQGMLGVA